MLLLWLSLHRLQLLLLCLRIRECSIADRSAMTLDGRSKEGKFLRRCESELARHVGGNPNFPQKLLIRRAARAMLRLELFDTKMVKGNFTTHDAHVYGGLSNTLRLCFVNLASSRSLRSL